MRLVNPLSLAMALLLAACIQREYVPTPTKTPRPTATPSLVPSPTFTPSITPSLTLVPTFSSTQGPTQVHLDTTPGTPTATLLPPSPDPNLPPEHYWFLRPIPPGYADYGDRTYAYGSTAGGTRRPHTGLDFVNPIGSPVLAAADSSVYYAGSDASMLFGPEPNFYGNVVVLQLSITGYNGQNVYMLYGHLSTINVQTGDSVTAGNIIGEVGSSGVAIGPHLHFEVRIGDPQAYATATRNPDLWIAPYNGYGTLAGRVVDGNGAYLRGVALTVHGVDATRYMWTYAGDENIPDDQWKENFTLGDLPAGWYTVTTRSGAKPYSFDIYVRSGRTSWLEIILSN